MMQAKKEKSLDNTRFLRITDIILLLFCSVVVAGRSQISESFPMPARLSGPVPCADIAGGEIPAMLILAGLICTTALVWLLARIRHGPITFRKTALIGPFLVLLTAAIISTLSASNKHTATVGAINLLTQIILAILLVQLLNAPWKQRLFLCVITATGMTLAYRCWEQNHYDIPETIKLAEQNPNKALTAQGIEPGTFAAQQFLARIQSKDIGGFFALSNTAAAFFIISIMTTLALTLGQLRQKISSSRWIFSAAAVLILLAQIAALLLTQSKGGITAAIFALLLLVILGRFRRFFRQHWCAMITIAVLLMLLAVAAIATYGLQHDRLPGNSLWVRWQYWQGTAAMIADHWFTGVGPENFGQYYTHYMNPAAPEVIKDPHCFPLALWSQWGLLAPVGFVWLILAVILRLTQPRPIETRLKPDQAPLTLWPCGLLITVGILALRAATSDLTPLTDPAERQGVYIISFLVPAVVWLTVFLVMLAATRPIKDNTNNSQNHQWLVPLVLACSLAGFLLHNSIDFAIFQPALGTLFFAVLALALAIRQQNTDSLKQFGKNRSVRITGAVIGIAFLTALWLAVIKPFATAHVYMKRAQTYALQGQLSPAADIAKMAGSVNRFDPAAVYFAARIYLLQWHNSHQTNQDYLEKSIEYTTQTIQRDPANYRYYQALSRIYRTRLAQHPDNEEYATRALDYALQAAALFPAKSELLIDCAQLLAMQGKNQEARTYFTKALANEEAFIKQQKQMWPEQTEIWPRLKPSLQNLAREQLKKLPTKTEP